MSISHDKELDPETRNRPINFRLSRLLAGMSHSDKTKLVWRSQLPLPRKYCNCDLVDHVGADRQNRQQTANKTWYICDRWQNTGDNLKLSCVA